MCSSIHITLLRSFTNTTLVASNGFSKLYYTSIYYSAATSSVKVGCMHLHHSLSPAIDALSCNIYTPLHYVYTLAICVHSCTLLFIQQVIVFNQVCHYRPLARSTSISFPVHYCMLLSYFNCSDLCLS